MTVMLAPLYSLGGSGSRTLPEYFKRRGYSTVGMGKIFHPVVDTQTGNIDDIPYSWTVEKARGGQPYFHPPFEKYWQNGARDPLYPHLNISSGPCAGGCPSHAAITLAGEAERPLPGPQLAAKAVAAMARLAQRDNPFFLAVGFHKPHLPFIVPARMLQSVMPEGERVQRSRSRICYFSSIHVISPLLSQVRSLCRPPTPLSRLTHSTNSTAAAAAAAAVAAVAIVATADAGAPASAPLLVLLMLLLMPLKLLSSPWFVGTTRWSPEPARLCSCRLTPGHLWGCRR